MITVPLFEFYVGCFCVGYVFAGVTNFIFTRLAGANDDEDGDAVS